MIKLTARITVVLLMLVGIWAVPYIFGKILLYFEGELSPFIEIVSGPTWWIGFVGIVQVLVYLAATLVASWFIWQTITGLYTIAKDIIK